jgi:hypothetical protein
MTTECTAVVWVSDWQWWAGKRSLCVAVFFFGCEVDGWSTCSTEIKMSDENRRLDYFREASALETLSNPLRIE